MKVNKKNKSLTFLVYIHTFLLISYAGHRALHRRFNFLLQALKWIRPSLLFPFSLQPEVFCVTCHSKYGKTELSEALASLRKLRR